MIGPAHTGPLGQPTEDAELHAVNLELAEWRREHLLQQMIGDDDYLFEYLRLKGETRCDSDSVA